MSFFVHPELGTLPLVPLQARAPMRETLAFLTDIMTSYNGTEGTRLRLRNKPRQRFDTDVSAPPEWSKDVYNTVRGNLSLPWLVPAWSQPRSVGTLTAGTTVVACDTQYADFRVGSPVLLVGACNTWFVTLVDSMDAVSLTLVDPTTELMRGAYAVPLHPGRLIGNAQKETSGYGASWRLNYEVDDNLYLEPDAPDQYHGDDIYLEPSLLSDGSLSEQPSINTETYDGETGAVKTYPTWTYPRNVRAHRAVTETDEEAWALRQFIYRRAGRYRPFWQPTFENDVRLAQAGALADTVLVRDDSRNPFAQDRINLAFGLRDGTWLPRRVIADAAAGVGIRQLTLESPLTVQAADVMAISYLGFKRLNTDTIELNWLGNSRCELAVPVLELTP